MALNQAHINSLLEAKTYSGETVLSLEELNLTHMHQTLDVVQHFNVHILLRRSGIDLSLIYSNGHKLWLQTEVRVGIFLHLPLFVHSDLNLNPSFLDHSSEYWKSLFDANLNAATRFDVIKSAGQTKKST